MFYFRISEVKSLKTSFYTELLSYGESENRLIMLLSIFATCCLILSTAFVLIVIRLYGKYWDPRIVPFHQNLDLVKGFPVATTLLISSKGELLTFNSVENKLSLLPGLPKLSRKPTENIFAFTQGQNIKFISTDFQKKIVDYDIAKKSHRKLPKSEFPCQKAGLNTYGFMWKKFFFVACELKMDDMVDFGNDYSYFQTYVWWIEREKWTPGPQIVSGNHHCSVPINDEEILVIDNDKLTRMKLFKEEVITAPNHLKLEYDFVSSDCVIPGHEFCWKTLGLRTCASFQAKNYQR